MRHLRLTILVIAALVCLPVLSVFAAPAAPSGPVDLSSWWLAKVKVVSAGTTVNTPQGSLTTDYVVEAFALARTGRASVVRGAFRMTLSVFTPRVDLPGQVAGRSYVTGAWTVTNLMAPPADLLVRHNQYVVKGSLNAELAFNPLSQAQLLPGMLQGAKWQSDLAALNDAARSTKLAAPSAQLYLQVNQRAGIIDRAMGTSGGK
ncbi:MAG: hypothetical protein KA765_19050 [Thermoflexales bacterium]|nr:hypothetical protein [Thermoflexales bacterium]